MPQQSMQVTPHEAHQARELIRSVTTAKTLPQARRWLKRNVSHAKAGEVAQRLSIAFPARPKGN